MSENGHAVTYGEIYEEFLALALGAATAANEAVKDGRASDAQLFGGAASWGANGIKQLNQAGLAKVQTARTRTG